MAGAFRNLAGKAMFNGWLLRKKLAETRRPWLATLVAVLSACSGLLLVAEGVILGWLLPHVSPVSWDLAFEYSRAPWIKFPQWLAAALLLLFGAMGVYAGLVLKRRRQLGCYFILALIDGLVVSGAVLLYTGIRFSGPYLTAAGAINVGVGMLLGLAVTLGWYTLDPLGLHQEPGY